jgi:hypothetical protein
MSETQKKQATPAAKRPLPTKGQPTTGKASDGDRSAADKSKSHASGEAAEPRKDKAKGGCCG